MGFHEDAIFPEGISYGSTGGPGFSTNIIELDSGAEERIANYSMPKYKYNAQKGLRTWDDVYEVIKFYIARLGPAYGFKYKDFMDYASTANGRTTSSNIVGDVDPAATDVSIGTGDGSSTTFQLVKKYTDGGVTRTRNIYKPISSTVLIAFDGVTESSSNYSVSESTGVITFTTAPSSNVDVTAGFQYYVPARFGEEIDVSLPAVLAEFDNASISNIPIVELFSPEETFDEYWYGGAKNWGAISSDTTISLLDGRVQTFEQTASSLTVILPSTLSLPGTYGGPMFLLINDGTTTLDVETSGGGSVVSITSGSSAELWISRTAGGLQTYYAR